MDASGVPLGGLRGCLGGLRRASLGLLGASWEKPSRIHKHAPKSPPRRPQEAPDGHQRPPKGGPRPPRGHKNNTKITSQVKTAKTSKMTTFSMKINVFPSKKLTKISQKRSQNQENRGKRAHHGAMSRRRAPSSHPTAPKGAETEASDHSPLDLQIDFAAGGPQGRLRARGVYLINQVNKE